MSARADWRRFGDVHARHDGNRVPSSLARRGVDCEDVVIAGAGTPAAALVPDDERPALQPLLIAQAQMARPTSDVDVVRF